jgi:2-polyprenyl-6-methoxyphenol hydroxylase-like FAD-dependent oxidoreductase
MIARTAEKQLMSDENHRTACCVVGAGPAGAMLSLLLARSGVPVTLLEAHRDFEREFRGDTIHPSTLEVLQQLGLAERLHALPHAKAASFRLSSADHVDVTGVFSRLPTPFPYMMMMPQARFLEFVTNEAKRYPHFRLLMGAHVDRLIEERGSIRGVGFRGDGEGGEVRAALTVACDGRFSRVRKLANLEPVTTSGPLEVMWFLLPRRDADPTFEAGLVLAAGAIAAVLPRPSHWQIGYVLPQGRTRALRTQGIAAFHAAIVAILPWVADRIAAVQDFSDVTMLSVQGSRLACWHKPGLLLIGDAAHVMTPVGGVGINCAIADAVEAHNVLTEPLRAGDVLESHLAEVQRRREGPTRTIQRFQARVQGGLIKALEDGKVPRVPLPVRLLLRIPLLRDLPARITAFGVRRVRVEHPEERPFSAPLSRAATEST